MGIIGMYVVKPFVIQSLGIMAMFHTIGLVLGAMEVV
jgi:hypothetical protein